MIYTYPESSHLPRAAGIGSLLAEPLADGEPCKVWAQICPSGSHISAQELETSQKPKALWKTNRGRRVSVSVGFRQRRHSEKQPEPLRLSLLYFLFVPSSTSLSFILKSIAFLAFVLYFATSGLSCGTRGLRCIRQNLPLRHSDSPAAAHRLPSARAQ